MRFTYYAATILFISTVWAIPVIIDLHARRVSSTHFQPYFEKLQHRPVTLSQTPASPNGKHPSTGKDAVGSTIIIRFWTVAGYEYLQHIGLPEFQHITIRDTPCDPNQKAQVVRSIETLLNAAKNAGGTRSLHLKEGTPRFVFQGNCQAQWLPAHNFFDFVVLDGAEGGKCEHENCYGLVYLQSGHGFLEDHSALPAFFDNSDQDDWNRFDSRHDALRLGAS